MKSPDINILVYAHREDQAHHKFYSRKLRNLLESGEPFSLTPSVASGFLRVTTHPNFPNGPTPLPVALSFVETVAGLPQCRWSGAGDRHWMLFSDLCRKTQATGKTTADAHHAATAIENVLVWISRDSDFQRFVPHGLRFELWEPDSER
jgi:toxin-antitoxin system PIN domain toxin